MIWDWRINSKESCPCGSGERYIDCCKGKGTTLPKKTKKPVEVRIMERMRASMEECCLHPDHANCEGRIKAAHALQNHKIISLLAGEEHHVYMLNPKKKPMLISVGKGEVMPLVDIDYVSANDATTETCFCDFHDDTVFAPIEKGAPDFDNSDIMKFTYAYKAFIFEYYKQMIESKIMRQSFKENPLAFQEKEAVMLLRRIQLRDKEFEPIKKYFDTQILSKMYNGVYTCVVKIPDQIKFAAYAYIAPQYDMNGCRIKHTTQGVMHRIALTIFPERGKSWLLLSCLDTEKRIYDKLFRQIQDASIEKIKYYLNLILPLYSENLVLSPDLWKTWSEEIQCAYVYYANLQGADVSNMELMIKYALKNACLDRSGRSYKQLPKINLFV